MTAIRKLELVTIAVDNGTVTFTRNADGASAMLNYSTGGDHPLSENDVAYSYDEMEALCYIADANDTEVERYVDETTGHFDDERRVGVPRWIVFIIVVAMLLIAAYFFKGN